MKLPECEIDRNAPLTAFERVGGALALVAPVTGLMAVAMICGCAYKGGKVIDGTNLEIGITIPGTEWSINALSYTGGMRVCGNDATHIEVTNRVDETNSYFGVVHTERHSSVMAKIIPVNVSTNASEVVR